MKIAFRMDDITPDMDWKSFGAFEQLFERYGCYPLLGIVPDNLDPKLSVDPAREAFWKKMQELQEKGWTLSMHGCHHVYTTKRGGSFPLNAQSELRISMRSSISFWKADRKSSWIAVSRRSCSWRLAIPLTKRHCVRSKRSGLPM